MLTAKIDYQIEHELTDTATLQLRGRMDIDAATVARAMRHMAIQLAFPYDIIHDDACYDIERGLVWERGYPYKWQESPRAVQLLQAADALDGRDFSRDFENDPATVADIWGD